MPRGDKTGPYGAGPMTGRAAGYCAGYSVPGYMNPRRGYGRGFGRGWGRGFGRGWGRGYGRGWYVYPPPAIVQPAYPPAYQPITQQQAPEQEVTALENYHKDLVAEKADLEKEMNDIKGRIEDLKAKLENKKPQTET
ncbi:DUF5320 domain-containing protein [Candidatus Bathyarchaeota archaeon]|nr:DUF5320 domain-containing protein [Candidatus Bathyarchaeota archaeon]